MLTKHIPEFCVIDSYTNKCTVVYLALCKIYVAKDKIALSSTSLKIIFRQLELCQEPPSQ